MRAVVLATGSVATGIDQTFRKAQIEVFNNERVKIHFTFEDTLKSYETE